MTLGTIIQTILWAGVAVCVGLIIIESVKHRKKPKPVFDEGPWLVVDFAAKKKDEEK